MTKLTKNLGASILLAVTVLLPASQPASALTAELAKKCRQMALKAHPPQLAGTKSTGVEKAQRDFFKECVAKNGKMEN